MKDSHLNRREYNVAVMRTIEAAQRGQAYRHWYDEARFLVEEWSRRYHVSEELVAAILATTSVRVSVKKNVAFALEVIRQVDSTPVHMIRKPKGLMEGVWVSTQRVLYARGEGLRPVDAIKGRKTRAFAECLLGFYDHVVLDVHMARHFDVPQSYFRTGLYDSYAQVVRAAAHELGWNAAETQAAVWADSLVQQGRKNVPSI